MGQARIVFVIVLLLLAGCRDKPDQTAQQEFRLPPGAKPPSVPICEAVLPGELEAFTGRTFKPGDTRMSKTDMYQCEWIPTAADDRDKIVLTMHPLAETALWQYSALAGMAKIEGPGTETWWSAISQTYVTRINERLIVVGFGSPDSNHPTLARKIVERAMERL
jgi:hypothetical protein